MSGLPKRFPDRTDIAAVRSAAAPLEAGQEAEETVRVAGRVVARRGHGKLVFLDLVDRSGRIQILADTSRTGELDLDLGDIVGVTGHAAQSRRGEPSLAADEVVLLAKNRRPLPDTFHGLTDTEARYRKRYLDLMMNEETRRDFLARGAMMRAIRSYLDGDGFVEVETPSLQADYGGAFARPFVTHHNELDRDVYLRIAGGELYLKRLLVGGLEKVYEVGRVFRNEGVSYKHNPEFTMLEWYEAYADYRDTMARFEELVERAALAVNGTTAVTYRGHELDLKRPWRRLRLVDALEEHGLWTRDADELRAPARGARHGHLAGPDLGAARRPRGHRVRRAVPDRADLPLRLPRRALALRPHERRRRAHRRALRGLRRRDGAVQRLLGAERQRRAGGAVPDAGGGGRGRERRGGARRPGLRRGALVRHAARGRARLRRRPARDGADGQGLDPGRGALPGAARAGSSGR